MPASTQRLRVIRYLGGQTYYVTVQRALRDQPPANEVHSSKGHKQVKQDLRPRSAPVQNEYKAIMQPVPIPPEFIYGKSERLERGPRWFRSRDRKLAAKQRKLEREKHAKEVRMVKTANKKTAMQGKPAPLPQPAIVNKQNLDLAVTWYAELRNKHPALKSLKAFPASKYCKLLPFRTFIRKNKLQVYTGGSETNNKLNEDLELLSKNLMKHKVEWLRLYEKYPCRCDNCEACISQGVYFGSSSKGEVVPPKDIHPDNCGCYECGK